MSEQYLESHPACCFVLQLSQAAEYILIAEELKTTLSHDRTGDERSQGAERCEAGSLV